MLRFPLIHPPLLAALAACGHGGKILLADANYSHSTNVHPGATTVYLNLRPGLLAVHQVLEPLLQAVPVEAAGVMTPRSAAPSPRSWWPPGSTSRTGCCSSSCCRPRLLM
jgi:L-fucose mutarotase